MKNNIQDVRKILYNFLWRSSLEYSILMGQSQNSIHANFRLMMFHCIINLLQTTIFLHRFTGYTKFNKKGEIFGLWHEGQPSAGPGQSFTENKHTQSTSTCKVHMNTADLCLHNSIYSPHHSYKHSTPERFTTSLQLLRCALKTK